ncbi:hypothetical protein ACN38_g7938 [Penicillium nordicum]|uniref:Uncharacterized protein n=1 Tax=Penicillium nordicum TaxID=229535 RepID=A0A0M8P5M6_9EURO|nr:hypothetical protein ACN38_g7938 [Penicillium nordicum]
MFILGGIILEISNHRYSLCYHLRANAEIAGQGNMLHEILSLVYLLIVLFRLDVFTFFQGLYGKRDIPRAGYIVSFQMHPVWSSGLIESTGSKSADS